MPALSRRRFLQTAAATLVAPAATLRAATQVPMADAHNHFGLLRDNRFAARSLGTLLREASIGLLSWNVVADRVLIRTSAQGNAQYREPNAGELARDFRQQFERAVKLIEDHKLLIVRDRADLDKVLAGSTGVVLACEGADFLEGRLEELDEPLRRGLRHLQLVHYSRNAVGDFQTEAPRHNGLSAFGKDLVRTLNERGVLVDVAHGTEALVLQTLEISKAPVIWSHSYLAAQHGTFAARAFRGRALGLAVARAIAKDGGAVGLWGLGVSFRGGDLPGYADEILRMVDLLGPEHVMFGSDVDGLGNAAVINRFGDLRNVADKLAARGLDHQTLHKLCIGNYARCLGAAFAGKTT